MRIDERTPVGRFDLAAGGGRRDDPYDDYDRLGAVPPFWTEKPPGDIDGYWVITRYADIRQVLQDPNAFSSAKAMIPYREMEHPLVPSFVDPPDTKKFRGILLPHMTADKIEPLEAKMHTAARDIIVTFRDRGHCDAVREFASVYPIMIFVDFFGLPPERSEEFRHHAQRFLHSVDDRPRSWSTIRGIVVEQLLAKRDEPKDDLLSAIANGEVDGELIDLEWATSLASTVFLGGLDTLPSNIAWSLRFLAQHADRRRDIVEDPAVTRDAVEEFLRFFSVANPVRRATRDVEIGGSMIRQDDRIMVLVSRGDRDPHEFGDADTVRFDRETNRHLAFGAGPHRCLGSHLARHELVVALNEWHRIIPEYRLMADPDVTYTGPVLALETLKLEWEV
jgi:cytochrome P450